MSLSKYTLDRIEDGYAVFLKFPAEEEQLIISQSAINKAVQVGDRVQIEEKMVFTILKFYKKKHNKKSRHSEFNESFTK